MTMMEPSLLALICCGAPLVLLGGGGMLLALLKFGVIGKYWLKGEEPVQDEGNYTLNDSVEASDDGADLSDDGSAD